MVLQTIQLCACLELSLASQARCLFVIQVLMVQKPTVSKRQFEDHIEYLKGELARATSQLNAARSELVASSESLAAAQSEINHLKSELVAAKTELANKSLPQLRDSRSMVPPTAQSVASSLRYGHKQTS